MLLAILFIIPGIIFSYSAYFSSQIMNDYPNLKPTEAIKLSKKMIKGNRWYDHDPTLSLTIELLRVVPRDIQRQAANNFIQILQAHGVNVEKAE